MNVVLPFVCAYGAHTGATGLADRAVTSFAARRAAA